MGKGRLARRLSKRGRGSTAAVACWVEQPSPLHTRCAPSHAATDLHSRSGGMGPPPSPSPQPPDSEWRGPQEARLDLIVGLHLFFHDLLLRFPAPARDDRLARLGVPEWALQVSWARRGVLGPCPLACALWTGFHCAIMITFPMAAWRSASILAAASGSRGFRFSRGRPDGGAAPALLDCSDIIVSLVRYSGDHTKQPSKYALPAGSGLAEGAVCRAHSAALLPAHAPQMCCPGDDRDLVAFPHITGPDQPATHLISIQILTGLFFEGVGACVWGPTRQPLPCHAAHRARRSPGRGPPLRQPGLWGGTLRRPASCAWPWSCCSAWQASTAPTSPRASCRRRCPPSALDPSSNVSRICPP